VLPLRFVPLALALCLGASLAGAAAAQAVGTMPSGAPAPGPARLPDTAAQRLAACTTCHGPQGRAAADGYHPRLAGKPAGYLFTQLRHFQQGRRHYGPMVALLEGLPEAYLHEMAAHFAQQQLPYPPPEPARVDAAQQARGRQLALQGDAARGLPACSACHGARLMGAEPALPGLLGLPRDYLIGQLGAWATGQRRAAAPDCMAQVVQRLAPGDVGAVAAWLASQPVPVPSRPDAAAPAPLPLACGALR
jgi:cytochrome c553